jgi:DNA repair and recombination RAD54-like protein
VQFYSLIEFCNPGILGSPEKFRKVFALPIEKGRDARYGAGANVLADWGESLM